MIAYYYCFVVYNYDKHEINNKCVQYFVLNKDNYKYIITPQFMRKVFNTNNSGKYFQKGVYQYFLNDLALFDSINNINNICNQRLIEYLKENLSLILGEFNIQIWLDKTNWWRQKVKKNAFFHNVLKY
eukprot:537236_1